MADQAECYICKLIIGKTEYVKLDEKVIHAKCFACKNCKCSLAGKGYMEHDESFYCQDCYTEMFSQKCAGCGKPIKERYMNVMGKSYHPQCFVCSQCTKPFQNGKYFKKDDKPVCEECFSDQAKKCRACGLPVTTQIFSAMNAFWHKDCFRCFKCKEPFVNEGFVNFEDNPYHQRCRQTLCIVCEKPITKEFYEIGDKQGVHVECYEVYQKDPKKYEKNDDKKPQQQQKQEPQKSNELEQQQKQLQAQQEKMKQEMEKIKQQQEEIERFKKEAEEAKKQAELAKQEAIEAKKKAIEEQKKEKEQELKQIEEQKKKEEEVQQAKAIELKQQELTKQKQQEELLRQQEQLKQQEESNSLPQKPRKSVVVNDVGQDIQNNQFDETLKKHRQSVQAEALQAAFYPLALLQKEPYPDGVNKDCRETYLSDTDFEKLFKMNKEAFQKIPLWKKNQEKKKAKLF